MDGVSKNHTSAAEKFVRWMNGDPCTHRAHQLVLGREAEILRRHDELSKQPSGANVPLRPDQLWGRARAEAYCASFDGPLLPGLDFLGEGPCVAPEFCSWILPRRPALPLLPSSPGPSTRASRPPPSYILSCHLTATSPTYNPLSNGSHPHAAIDKFLRARAVLDGLAAGTMQVRAAWDAPCRMALLCTFAGTELRAEH